VADRRAQGFGVSAGPPRPSDAAWHPLKPDAIPANGCGPAPRGQADVAEAFSDPTYQAPG